MDFRPVCKYGKECYRLNDQHQKQYQHPKKRKRNEEDNMGGEEQSKRMEVKEEVQKIDKSKLSETNAENSESEKEDNERNTESPVDVKEFINLKYLVDFPDDLYLMWQFCVQQNSIKPEETFNDTLNLKLVGPFDILAGNHKGKKTRDGKKPNFLLHWRYYYDPPEFTTLMKGDSETQFHIGYYRYFAVCVKGEESVEVVFVGKVAKAALTAKIAHVPTKLIKGLEGKTLDMHLMQPTAQGTLQIQTLVRSLGMKFWKMIVRGKEKKFLWRSVDDPNCMPDFVASNSANENGCIRFVGENLFSAIRHFLEEKIKSTEKNIDLKKMSEKQLKDLCEFSKKNNLELNYKTMKSKSRDEKIVCKTLHGAGIVVPIDENGVGYRPVPETQGDLKKMFKRIVESKNENERHLKFEPLQELITYIQFANDECDYGEGLELGLDLFTYGGEVFHSTILTLLPLAYQLLGRSQYAQIIKTHLKYRNHSSDLSQLF